MAIKQPPEPQYEVERTGISLRIRIPARRRLYSVLTLSFQFLLWLIFVLYGWQVVYVLRHGQLVDNPWDLLINNPLPTLLLLIAFGIWILFGRYIIYSWLWEVVGHEIVEGTDQVLRIRRTVLGFTHTQQYSTEHIEDIRAVPPTRTTWSWTKIMLREPPGGTIAFDYGAETIRFGAGASEAEAKQIVAELERGFSPVS